MHTGVSSNLHVPWHDRGQVIKIKFHAYAKLDQGPVSFCYKQGRGKARGGPKNQSAPKIFFHFPVHLYILCAVCTQDTFPKFDLYEAFYVKSAYFRRFGRKIKINRNFLECLATFQSTYTYCVQCAHKTPSQNSTYMRRFTSNPPIFGVSAEKIKINRKFLGMLSHFPVHLYILCGVCTQDTVSKFDF
ncbi:unnamed protein product [Trifolium pratense]|uniref:Uncharacterized protein n=1 Tax=Trifolium pratense TaxID=57577 RepID=A0ACB0LVH9_TRIPR|nr:unnamed protein product [Trifolium pratense]